MIVSEIIRKTRDGGMLTPPEIIFLVDGYVRGEIPDYQISAWLMAVFFRGLGSLQTGLLTQAMINSGTTIDFSTLDGPVVDKHSTGGVGDKVSLILAPLVAASGVFVPMMSGRALGHTGGTLDKLESIPGYRTDLSPADFRSVVTRCGFAMVGQSRDIVPADRLMYALRDVTATVESIPLITASILSKKFAEGARQLVLDVKCGSGAFMKTPTAARELAESLVRTAAELGRPSTALLTDMSRPLGRMVGNFLEVDESLLCLLPDSPAWQLQADGRLSGPCADLMELTLQLAAEMLVLAAVCATADEARGRLLQAHRSGAALERFLRNVHAQHGDLAVFPRQSDAGIRVSPDPVTGCDRVAAHRRAAFVEPVSADRSGVVGEIDAMQIGLAGVAIGVGRRTTQDTVLPNVGIEIAAAVGTTVSAGQPLCYVHFERSVDRQILPTVAAAFRISDAAPTATGTIVFDRIGPAATAPDRL